jgi:tetratricopeptide (TPR) repeat protein
MGEIKRIYLEGLEMLSQGEDDGALSKFKEVLGLKPLDDTEKFWVSSCHFSISVIHYGRGEMRKAKRSLLKSMKDRDPASWTQLALGDISESLGQHAAAGRYYDRCEELATLEKDEDLLEVLAKRKRPSRRRKKSR